MGGHRKGRSKAILKPLGNADQRPCSKRQGIMEGFRGYRGRPGYSDMYGPATLMAGPGFIGRSGKGNPVFGSMTPHLPFCVMPPASPQRRYGLDGVRWPSGDIDGKVAAWVGMRACLSRT